MSRLTGHITAILAALFLIFAGQQTIASPVPDGWDKALNQYEAICKRCLDLRDRSLQGELIPADTFKDLLLELENLRKTIQSGSGEMTEEQRARFERIRQTYLQSSPSSESVAVTEPEVPVEPPLVEATEAEPLPIDAAPQLIRVHFGIAPVASVPLQKGLSAKDLSAGLMLIAHDGKTGLGAYIKGTTTFHYKKVSGICFQDGTLQDGSYFYAAGSTGWAAYSITGGLIYRFHRNVGIWAGAGYAAENVYWQSTDGAWYRIKDACRCGVCPEAGLMFTVGSFCKGRSLIILAGGRFPLAKKASVDVGLGWMF